MENGSRVRIRPPAPEGDISPFLSPQATDVHVGLICGRLASDLNLLLDGYPSFHGLDAASVYGRTGTLPRMLREDVRFAAAGVVCHEWFFGRLTEGGGHVPDEASARALRTAFGSTDSFFYIFREEAQRMQMGGFLWLCTVRGARTCALRLLPLHGYELPPPALAPVFALDLWEHAYLAGYGEDRRSYADAFLRQLDWPTIGVRLRAMV